MREKREIASVSSVFGFAKGFKDETDAGIMIPGAPPVYGRCGASRAHPRVHRRVRAGIVAANAHRGLRVRQARENRRKVAKRSSRGEAESSRR